MIKIIGILLVVVNAGFLFQRRDRAEKENMKFYVAYIVGLLMWVASFLC